MQHQQTVKMILTGHFPTIYLRFRFFPHGQALFVSTFRQKLSQNSNFRRKLLFQGFFFLESDGHRRLGSGGVMPVT